MAGGSTPRKAPPAVSTPPDSRKSRPRSSKAATQQPPGSNPQPREAATAVKEAHTQAAAGAEGAPAKGGRGGGAKKGGRESRRPVDKTHAGEEQAAVQPMESEPAAPSIGRKRARKAEEPAAGSTPGKSRSKGRQGKTAAATTADVAVAAAVAVVGETSQAAAAVAAVAAAAADVEGAADGVDSPAADGKAGAAGGKAGAGGKKAAAKPRSRKAKEEQLPAPVYSYDMRPPPLEGPGFRVVSWNVAGLRALLKKDPGALSRLVESEAADVVCIQEVKAGGEVDKGALAEQMGLAGWHWCWCTGDTKGYSGVAIASRAQPLRMWCNIDVAEHDKEGRVVTAEFADVFVVNVYVPNSSEGLKRLGYRVQSWDTAFSAYVKGLEQRKPVVLTGDMNCAHKEIDIHSPKTNLRSAGFTQEERDSFDACYIQQGFVDTWREQHPGVVGYTYWTYKFNCRAKNKGWRLDYFLVSNSLKERVHDSYIKYDVMGSDHCPLGLILKP